MEIYSAQVNELGNAILCHDTIARKNYRVIYTGSFYNCRVATWHYSLTVAR
jgi:hypothetical protein